jgi:hypothetical protein
MNWELLKPSIQPPSMVLWPVLVYVVPNQQIQVRKVPPRGMTWRTEELVARWRLHEAKLGDGTRGGGSGAAAARLAELARGGTRARERVRPRRRKRARQSPTPTAHVERQSFTGSEAELQRRNASGLVRFRGIQSGRNNKCMKKIMIGIRIYSGSKINLPIMIARTRDRRAGLVPYLLTSGLIPSLLVYLS